MTDVPSPAIPTRLDDVTPAWLTSVLQRRAPGATVDRVVLDGATDGTTAGAIARLDGRGGLPSSLFVKLAPRDRPTRAFVGALGLGRTEVAFYRDARDRVGARIAEEHGVAEVHGRPKAEQEDENLGDGDARHRQYSVFGSRPAYIDATCSA